MPKGWSLWPVLALALKELRALIQDKRSRFILVGPPVIQLLVFGYAATFDLDRIPIAVYDADGGPAARTLIGRLVGSPVFDYLGTLPAERSIAEVIDDREALMVLRIDPAFSERVARGLSGTVQAVVDGRNSNTALIALGYLRTVVEDLGREWAEAAGQSPAPAELEVRAWFNSNLSSRWFIVPGIVALLTLVISLVTTALSVAREREEGTFEQLLVTPLRPAEILIGKALPGFLVGSVVASFIVLMAVWWFEVPLRGSLGALYAGLLLFLFSAVGIGLMISAITRTQQQGLLGGFLFMVPAVILSGFATPIENMSRAVQLLTYLDPLRYFLVVLRSVFLQGAGPADLTSQYWPMAAIGGASMVAAAWLFRRRLN